MPDKKTERPHDDPSESQRFIDMARELDTDERDGSMDKAFKKVIPAPQKKK